jgi:hypothetical protein
VVRYRPQVEGAFARIELVPGWARLHWRTTDGHQRHQRLRSVAKAGSAIRRIRGGCSPGSSPEGRATIAATSFGTHYKAEDAARRRSRLRERIRIFVDREPGDGAALFEADQWRRAPDDNVALALRGRV